MKLRASTVLFVLWGAMALGVASFFLVAPPGMNPFRHGSGGAGTSGEATVGSHVPVLSPEVSPSASSVRPRAGKERATDLNPSLLRPPSPPSYRPRRSLGAAAQPTEKALEIIEDLLDKKPASEEGARVQLVQRLAKLKSEPRALKRLVSVACSGPTRGERLAAIDALANTVDPGAREALGKIAEADADLELRRRAALALAHR